MTVPPVKSPAEEKKLVTLQMKRSELRQVLMLAVEGMAAWRRAAEVKAGGGPQIGSEDAAVLTGFCGIMQKVRDEL